MATDYFLKDNIVFLKCRATTKFMLTDHGIALGLWWIFEPVSTCRITCITNYESCSGDSYLFCSYRCKLGGTRCKCGPALKYIKNSNIMTTYIKKMPTSFFPSESMKKQSWNWSASHYLRLTFKSDISFCNFLITFDLKGIEDKKCKCTYIR